MMSTISSSMSDFDILRWANKHADNGRYFYTEKLGEGGFGCVLKALDKNECHVAVKLIRAKKSIKQYFLRRMPKDTKQGVEEAKLLTNLNHDNIVKIREYFECTRHREVILAVVMEFCPTDLNNYLQNRFKPNFAGRLSEDYSLRWCTQLALALEYIHKKDYVHRDLKPSNILVTSTNNLKVADVGLAKIFHSELHNDTSLKEYMQTVAGTRPYMAPEVWQSHYDQSADIFSMGLVMFTLCEVPKDLLPMVQGHYLGEHFAAHASSRQQEPMSFLQAKKCLQDEIELFNSMLQYNRTNRPVASRVVKSLKDIKEKRIEEKRQAEIRRQEEKRRAERRRQAERRREEERRQAENQPQGWLGWIGSFFS